MLNCLELTAETAPQVKDLLYKVFGYTHSSTHLYTPQALLARYRDGDFIPILVADAETGRLLGYFDIGFPFGTREVAWFGCLALDPDLTEMPRMAVLNTLLRDCIRKVGQSFRDDGLRLVITTDTTDHTLSQRLSGQFGLKCVGLLYSTVPAGRHMFRGAYRPQGTKSIAQEARRPETLSVYPAYKFLSPYETYLTPRYADLLEPLYADLEMPVTFGSELQKPLADKTVLHEYHDIGRGIATLEIAEIGLDIGAVLQERIDHYRTGFVPAIHVLVPQYPTDPEPAFETLAAMGGVFGGLFPRFKGRDMVVVQVVDPVDRTVDADRLKDAAARRVLDHATASSMAAAT